MPQQKSLSEQLPLEAKTPLYPWLKRLLTILEPRFGALEDKNDTLDATIELVREVALFRINEVLLPSVIRIQALTSLGFLVATSTNALALTVGPKTITIDPGTERDLFTPSPFISVEADDDRATFAIARRDGYDPKTGRLDFTILQAFGSTATKTAWTVSSSAGVSLAIRQSVTDAATSAANALASENAAKAARDAALAARDTADTYAGRSGAFATQSGNSAAASAASAATAQDAATKVVTPVIYGGPQNLNGAQQKQAKSNIGALGISYAYLSKSTTLQPSDAGNLFLCSGGGVVVTLPAAQDMKSGSLIVLQCWNGGSTDVKLVGGGNIGFLGEGLSTVKLREGSTIFFFCTGTEWLAFGAHAPLKAAVNALEAQSFTAAQRRQAKGNIGSDGLGYGGNQGATVTLSSAAIGTVVYLSGAAATVTLPAMASGQNVKLVNGSSAIKTIAVPAGATLGSNFSVTTNGTYALLPGATATFECYSDDGSVFAMVGSSPNHLNADVSQSFSFAQRRKVRENLKMRASQFAYDPADQTYMNPDQVGMLIYYDVNRTVFLPPFANVGLGDEITIWVQGAATQVTVKPSPTDGLQLVQGPAGAGGASVVLKGGALYTFIAHDSCWRYTGMAQNPVDLSGAAFTGTISAPSVQVNGRAIYGATAGGTTGGSSADLTTSSESRLSYSFIATGATMIATASAHCSNNSSSSADIYYLLRLIDQTEGNAVVQDKKEISYAAPVAGSTAPRSLTMYHTGLTIGHSYLLNLILSKGQAVGPIYPNNLQIQHANF